MSDATRAILDVLDAKSTRVEWAGRAIDDYRPGLEVGLSYDELIARKQRLSAELVAYCREHEAEILAALDEEHEQVAAA